MAILDGLRGTYDSRGTLRFGYSKRQKIDAMHGRSSLHTRHIAAPFAAAVRPADATPRLSWQAWRPLAAAAVPAAGISLSLLTE